MPKSSLLPDPIPLRDALRGLRFVLQRGGETLVSVLPPKTQRFWLTFMQSTPVMSNAPRPGILPEALPPTNEPLRLAVRRLRWFRMAFDRFVHVSGERIGCTFDLDEAALAEIFLRWLKMVEVQKPHERAERHDYFAFAAGLMLRELCAAMPIKAKAAPTKSDAASAASLWPEGYVCTMFCPTVHSAAMRQEFHEGTEVTGQIDDLRQWWSFRENTSQDPAFSAGFLQMVLGQQPNWTMPDVFRARLDQEMARRNATQ